jgi:hypothetical protein
VIGLLLAVLALAALGGGVAYATRNRRALPASTSSPVDDWRAPFAAAGELLGGRVAVAGKDVQLRAEAGGVTVTVTVLGGALVAEAPMLPGAPLARVFLGGGGAQAPSDFVHVPERPPPPAYSVEPPVSLRSDDAARATAFAEAAAPSLNAHARATRTMAVSALIRGGSLRLEAVRATPSVDALSSAVSRAAELVALLGGDATAAAARLAQLPARAEGTVVCALCGGERRPGVAWVQCKRCGAPHHAECFPVGGACARCENVMSAPLE